VGTVPSVLDAVHASTAAHPKPGEEGCCLGSVVSCQRGPDNREGRATAKSPASSGLCGFPSCWLTKDKSPRKSRWTVVKREPGMHLGAEN